MAPSVGQHRNLSPSDVRAATTTRSPPPARRTATGKEEPAARRHTATASAIHPGPTCTNTKSAPASPSPSRIVYSERSPTVLILERKSPRKLPTFVDFEPELHRVVKPVLASISSVTTTFEPLVPPPRAQLHALSDPHVASARSPFAPVPLARTPPASPSGSSRAQPPVEPSTPPASTPPRPHTPRTSPALSQSLPCPYPRAFTPLAAPLPCARDTQPSTRSILCVGSTATRPARSGSSRGPQPIIPITPAPRSPVTAYAGASRSPTAPYSIYGAGSILSGGRRSPVEFSSSAPGPHGPSSSSGSRRNTLSGPGGPQPIDPVPLRDYPYPGGASKHPDDYPPPAFSAPAYGSRPESPQTATGKSRRTGGGQTSTSSRSTRDASVKRSIGGAAEVKRATDRSRERDKNERELDKEREEHMYREREREKLIEREREERVREREYEEARAIARERERERERERQHELEMRDRDARRPPAPSKRMESEYARRPPEDWDRMRERDRGRERDWRREQEDPRLSGKHLAPLASHGYPEGKQSHLHHNIPLQQSRASHHYGRHPTPPPSLPILSPIWLGTHVYPNLPFPVCLPPSLARNNLSSDGYRPYQYTILVPYGFLPPQPAARVPRPTIPLWGSAVTGYTDDSNLLLAAVHSGRTNWSDIRRARRLKQDAKIIVGVWVGGANGGRNAVRAKGGAWEGGQGSGQLYSSSWGNSHDGGGMEIVEKDSAHAPHRPNRRERMEQYAKRRADLDLVPPVKRDRIDTWYLDSDDEDAQLTVPAKRTWDVGETIVFGKGGTTSGFVYDPHALRSVVFEESNERSTKRLKSKPNKQGDEDVVSRRDIVLENDDEQYILSLNDKAKTYTLSTLSPKSKKTEVLRKSVTEEDVSFFDKGLCVWIKDDDRDQVEKNKGSEPPYDETMSNDRKGWFCHVNRWKFAPETETPATVDVS